MKKINNKILPFPTFLSDRLNEILEIPQPKSNHGIIFKREPHKLSEDEIKFLEDNQTHY